MWWIPRVACWRAVHVLLPVSMPSVPSTCRCVGRRVQGEVEEGWREGMSSPRPGPKRKTSCLTTKHDVSCVTFVAVLIKVRKFGAIPGLLRLSHERVRVVSVCFSHICGITVFCFLNRAAGMIYINWFCAVEPALHTCDSRHLATVYNSFRTYLAVIC